MLFRSETVAALPASMWHDASIHVGELPVVSGDPARLRLLVRQLFDGAHQRQGSERLMVRVWATGYDGGVRLSIDDNGVGIPEPVSGIDADDGQDVHAWGLGMAICHRIAGQHGGRLWVESDGRDGTTVHVTLERAIPVARSAACEDTWQ